MSETKEPLAQCESCGDRYPESELKFKHVPGATLVFCAECTGPTKAEMYGVGRW